MESTSYVTTTINEHIACVEFYHPASNSFPSTQLADLTNAITVLNTNKEVHLIVLKSAGEKAFCAGASFDELLSITNLEQGKQFFSGFANVINAMRTSNKIIIGRIQGKTVGGGVGLAAACDYTFATKNALIKLSELAIGIGPFVIEPAVSRKIGKPALAEMTLDAENWKSAEWAFNNKLFTHLFDDAPQMDEALEKFAEKLSNYNPEALHEMKKVLWEGTENWDTLLKERAAISGKLVLSDFTVKALNAFKGM
ncbi:enoyl-CoA hydratase/isomerase family protein [Myroides sp. JBRI-B21084]|uniref:enoyl-CoA hydratase/isomerase family protein n=1 Tax=Myroides sp. JBRI-B21084 TaxID=3119977 RepID=UPI0026E43282|nr:enoyl-CoA hydratase/isomerase family protein [Paenimyroides cloacae]WKW46953.1 enoyl-CoA hydratase/isomerase family protein [Paenimyroides cloacae]